MIGGAVVYAGDQVIDGSLRGRLEKLSCQPCELNLRTQTVTRLHRDIRQEKDDANDIESI